MWFDVPDAGLASSHEGSWEAGLRGAVRPLCTEQPMQAQARLFGLVRERHCGGQELGKSQEEIRVQQGERRRRVCRAAGQEEASRPVGVNL